MKISLPIGEWFSLTSKSDPMVCFVIFHFHTSVPYPTQGSLHPDPPIAISVQGNWWLISGPRKQMKWAEDVVFSSHLLLPSPTRWSGGKITQRRELRKWLPLIRLVMMDGITTPPLRGTPSPSGHALLLASQGWPSRCIVLHSSAARTSELRVCRSSASPSL